MYMGITFTLICPGQSISQNPPKVSYGTKLHHNIYICVFFCVPNRGPPAARVRGKSERGPLRVAGRSRNFLQSPHRRRRKKNLVLGLLSRFLLYLAVLLSQPQPIRTGHRHTDTRIHCCVYSSLISDT